MHDSLPLHCLCRETIMSVFDARREIELFAMLEVAFSILYFYEPLLQTRFLPWIANKSLGRLDMRCYGRVTKSETF
jgi:hypothetical protein